MATEVEQLYLHLELINIEEQMLKLKMLKNRRQRRRSRGWCVRPAEAEQVNLQHWLWIHYMDEQMHFRSFRMSKSFFAVYSHLDRKRQLPEIAFWADQSQPLRPTSTRRVVRIFGGARQATAEGSTSTHTPNISGAHVRKRTMNSAAYELKPRSVMAHRPVFPTSTVDHDHSEDMNVRIVVTT